MRAAGHTGGARPFPEARVEKRLIVVDAYNLILRTPALRPEPGRTLRDSRQKLLNLLAWALGTGDASFVVVFDGAEGGGHDGTTGRVEVRYSRPPRRRTTSSGASSRSGSAASSASPW